MTRLTCCLLLGAMALAASANIGAQTVPAAKTSTEPSKPAASTAESRQLNVTAKPWTGDFDKMLERRMIRVAVPYSRSLYFIDKGRERGLAAELIRDLERWMNTKYAKQLGKRPLTIYIVATTRDELFSDLRDGLADIAVGNLTITEERLKLVDFVAPDDKLVNVEILVTGPASPAIASLNDMAGKTVHVRKASSYYESLIALNERLKKEGKAPV
ncbi:MAG: transporter substrate-binding domain-containing protein, partial [Burkholderiaceae bacterium]